MDNRKLQPSGTGEMMPLPTSKEIRQQFIDFFTSRGHSFVPSSPVIPTDDPTLLFTNAGMNQFKSIFLGTKEITIPRAVNSQKCIRAGGKHNDLEEVGKDGYHHTFFEMLGNWSFGDYYKSEAITWAWELLTQTWQLPKHLLFATVHDTDREAYELWKSLTDIDPAHISFHGDKDNFWEMGETGPCGPCSEIHIDRGADHCEKHGIEGHVCQVNGDCGRYIELWNLVFIQYNRLEDRSLQPLTHKFVDTGAGFERVTQVLQNKRSNYDTDLFIPIIDKIAQLAQKPYNPETDVSHRVIADHIRCLCFALADGGFPSNEGRGYVLRRILRRAARHGRLLGFAEPFLCLLTDTVVEVMGDHFTELQGKLGYLKMVIKAEEERFNKTLDTGLERFREIAGHCVDNTISGADAFMLYDTFGFPLDLTHILAREQGLLVDEAGFDREMEQQRQRARNSSKFGASTEELNWVRLANPTPTEFVGYREPSTTAQILSYALREDGTLMVQLDRTPFYAESGGQVADTGVICNDSLKLRVFEVKKQDDSIIHYTRLEQGSISDAPVQAEIDQPRRQDIARNHTATHILHRALKEVLGEHVVQKGSLVHPDYFRFDFAHFQALSKDELQRIEEMVNEVIIQNRALSVNIKSIDQAKAEGAMALFGEKYGEQVRVVTIADWSKELCGGTHAGSTGELGLFRIISESSSAAGIRRIEGITGHAALKWVNDLQSSMERISHKLHSPVNSVEAKLEAQLASQAALEAELHQLRSKAGSALAEQLLQTAKPLNEIKLMIAQTSLTGADELKQLAEYIKEKSVNTISVIFNLVDAKLSIICTVSSDILGSYHAGKLVGRIAVLLDGKGGGRNDLAMAGGKAVDKLPEVIGQIPELLSTP